MSYQTLFKEIAEKRNKQADVARNLAHQAWYLDFESRSREGERLRDPDKVAIYDVLGVSHSAFIQGIEGQTESELSTLRTLMNLDEYTPLGDTLNKKFKTRKLTESEFRYVENLVPLMKEVDRLNGFEVHSNLAGYRGYGHVESVPGIWPLQNLPSGTRKLVAGEPWL